MSALKQKLEIQANPEKWLVNMAISSDHLKEGNTFQKSIWLHLATLVTPILKEVIAFCDRNSGLEQTKGRRKHETFLLILERIGNLSLTNASPREFNFEAQFPFSQSIVAFFDGLMEQASLKQNGKNLKYQGLSFRTLLNRRLN